MCGMAGHTPTLLRFSPLRTYLGAILSNVENHISHKVAARWQQRARIANSCYVGRVTMINGFLYFLSPLLREQSCLRNFRPHCLAFPSTSCNFSTFALPFCGPTQTILRLLFPGVSNFIFPISSPTYKF